jgi:hypothetical protein
VGHTVTTFKYMLTSPPPSHKLPLSLTAAKITSSAMIRYGVDDRESIPGRRIDFSIRRPFQTASTAQLVTDPMGKAGSFLGDNAIGLWLCVPRLKPMHLHGVTLHWALKQPYICLTQVCETVLLETIQTHAFVSDAINVMVLNLRRSSHIPRHRVRNGAKPTDCLV